MDHFGYVSGIGKRVSITGPIPTIAIPVFSTLLPSFLNPLSSYQSNLLSDTEKLFKNCHNICYGWIVHLHHWYAKSGLYQIPQIEYWNSDFRSWIYIKSWSQECMYNMSYSGVVSSVPFLAIIIVFAPVRTTDQIWWCPFQIPHLCEILHLLTYKSSHV